MHLGYVILYVKDVKKTINFYEKAFDLKLRFLHESKAYAEMETGQTLLAFVSEDMIQQSHAFRKNSLTKEPAGIEISFVTDNVEKQYNTALKAGAASVIKPEHKPWGQTICYVKDNNGCLVEICSPISK